MRRPPPCSTSSAKWRWPAATRVSTISSNRSSPGASLARGEDRRRRLHRPALEEHRRFLLHDRLAELVDGDLADACDAAVGSRRGNAKLDDVGHHAQRVRRTYRPRKLHLADAGRAQAAGAEHALLE